MFYGYGGAHGYAYIFPKRGHVNVGIGYVLPYFKEQVDVAPYDLAAAVRRRPARPRHDGRRIAAASTSRRS